MANKKAKSKVVKTESNPNHKLIEEKAEESNKKKDKGFFTVRNFVLISFFSIVAIAIIVCTVLFITPIQWDKLGETIASGFVTKIGILWFVLLIFYFAYSIFTNYATLWLRIRKLGYKIPQWEYWLYAAATSFLRAVTPTLFTDPYTIFWLKTHGISTSRATSLMFSNTLIWQIIQFTVTFPSFVMVLIYRDQMLYTGLANNWEYILAFSLLCAGIVIDAFSIAFMVMLNLSKKMHSGMSKVFNWIKKKLHMKYHTKAEIEKKYKEQATIKRDFINYMKDWKTTILVFVTFTLNELVLYFAVVWALYFVKNVSYTVSDVAQNFVVTFSFGWAFNCANVTFTAARLAFLIPGGEGAQQWLLSRFLDQLGSPVFDPVPTEDIKNEIQHIVSNNGILVWRVFGNYLPAFVGLAAMIGLTVKQVGQYKKNKTLVAEHE